MKIKQAPLYSDIDLNFIPHPLTGDLVTKTNIEAIKQSLRNVVFMEPFDIPFDPDKKSGLREILFDQASQLTESRIRTTLEWLIKTMEKRVELIKIDVLDNPSIQGYDITIWYEIKSLMITDSVKFFAQRVR